MIAGIRVEAGLLCGLLMLLLLCGCGSPESKGTHYADDEKYLLSIATEEILQLETEQAYEQIYTRFGSRSFQEAMPLRQFLKMANCVEQHLGAIVSYDRKPLNFHRKQTDTQRYDAVTVPVLRVNERIAERLIYVQEGVDFKLNALYWSSANERFTRCIHNAQATPAGLPPENLGAAADGVFPVPEPQSGTSQKRG